MRKEEGISLENRKAPPVPCTAAASVINFGHQPKRDADKLRYFIIT